MKLCDANGAGWVCVWPPQARGRRGSVSSCVNWVSKSEGACFSALFSFPSKTKTVRILCRRRGVRGGFAREVCEQHLERRRGRQSEDKRAPEPAGSAQPQLAHGRCGQGGGPRHDGHAAAARLRARDAGHVCARVRRARLPAAPLERKGRLWENEAMTERVRKQQHPTLGTHQTAAQRRERERESSRF